MPACTLSTTAFTGKVTDAESIPRAPNAITPRPRKAGVSFPVATGEQVIVIDQTDNPGGIVTTWELRWTRVPEATRAAVYAIYTLAGAFTFTDATGSRQVACDLEAYEAEQDDDAIRANGVRYYDVTLELEQVL